MRTLRYMKSDVLTVLSGSFLEEQTTKLNRNKSLSTKRSIASLYSLSAMALGLSETSTMRMKSSLTLGLALSAITFGSLGVAPTAYAVMANHSGTICKNSSRGDVTFIDYLSNGTRSYKTSATTVICPLTRNTVNNNGAYVTVDVTHTGRQTTNCVLFSNNYKGTLIAAAGSADQTFSGYQEIVLNLSGADKSNRWSDYSVRCVIPGNGNAIIHGVEMTEY